MRVSPWQRHPARTAQGGSGAAPPPGRRHLKPRTAARRRRLPDITCTALEIEVSISNAVPRDRSVACTGQRGDWGARRRRRDNGSHRITPPPSRLLRGGIAPVTLRPESIQSRRSQRRPPPAATVPAGRPDRGPTPLARACAQPPRTGHPGAAPPARPRPRAALPLPAPRHLRVRPGRHPPRARRARACVCQPAAGHRALPRAQQRPEHRQLRAVRSALALAASEPHLRHPLPVAGPTVRAGAAAGSGDPGFRPRAPEQGRGRGRGGGRGVPPVRRVLAAHPHVLRPEAAPPPRRGHRSRAEGALRVGHRLPGVRLLPGGHQALVLPAVEQGALHPAEAGGAVSTTDQRKKRPSGQQHA